MVTMASITMNAGEDIPGSTIKWNLLNNAKHFDRVIVVDGHLTDESRQFYNDSVYSKMNHVQVIDSSWQDSYVTQYRSYNDRLEDGEWCLYLDCDEVPSQELLSWLAKEMPKILESHSDINMFYLPCVLHIAEDGMRYYPVEPEPPVTFKRGQWVKHILFKKSGNLDFRYFGSHVIPTFNQSERATYVKAPYYHMKSLESFVYNDVWQAFLSPEGQGYDPVEAAQFKMFTKQYKTTAEFKKATLESNWPPMLEKFAWSKRREFNRPISRLAWVYFVLEGAIRPGQDEDMQWCRVKQHVLGKESMELLRENKEKGNFIEIT